MVLYSFIIPQLYLLLAAVLVLLWIWTLVFWNLMYKYLLLQLIHCDKKNLYYILEINLCLIIGD